MKIMRAAVFAALSICLSGLPSWAQDITLRSPDGAVEINGLLLGFDGEFYRVQTRYGELSIDGSGVQCEGPGCPNLTEFVAEVSISGAAGMADVLMPALLDGFALRNGFKVARYSHDRTHFTYEFSDPDSGAALARFHLRAATSAEGFADLLANEADIAMSLREIREAEARLGYEAGLGNLRGKNRSRVVALDALVPVVAAGNPVTRISARDLALVFAGQITNWQDIGGPDAPIAVHVPQRDTGLLEALEDLLIQPANVALSDAVVEHAQMAALVSAVQRDPFAIGMATHSSARSASVLPLSGGCGFGIHASRRAIKTEDYPLNAPMFLYLPARRLPKMARDFLAYMRGPAAQIVIRRAGFVDQSPEEITVAQQGERFANAIAQAGQAVPLEDLQSIVARLGQHSRLTTTFRFQPGVSALDAQSRSNAQQLARALELGTYDGRELVFVGFSDGAGSAEANREIALRRANAVKTAVLAAAENADTTRLAIAVEAYGEALPMACDESAWGRQVNRRVEIWLR
ncbi:phosphate ABC transporter substrate-binding/OmpA family protein [Cognatishimia sp. SS12]|uniref:phosphate ABC transporter substrate-binding/OmpA family protein n=1 Tax=Cognatishimia sp. SS12 TaxID=2979465 RepID=UPI00232AC707|nr:phosphate ABC transporter substrate-binding/OmpA family protein [Cognatishimia sp. SS12]MDC0737687.1 phosphate ABC transporter substrate-binding/OmpA family protein [Cognatishimia sp. SS12]